MSQTFSLNPDVWTDLMLKPWMRRRIVKDFQGEDKTWVGVIVEMSSLARFFRIVVLPALSSPSKRILKSFSSEDFSFLRITVVDNSK